jgi:hypothetical protein
MILTDPAARPPVQLREMDSTHYEAVFETKVGYPKFMAVEVTRAEGPSSRNLCRCAAYPEVP